MGRYRLDLANYKHPRGRLTAIAYSHSDKTGQAVWDCVCDCGAKKQLPANFIKSGHILSCGCLSRDRRIESAKKYEAFGDFKTVREWSEDPRCCVQLCTLYERVRVGWRIENAIATPPTKKTRQTNRRQRPTCLALRPHEKAIPLRELMLARKNYKVS